MNNKNITPAETKNSLAEKQKNRIHSIDFLRGFAIGVMTIYHLMFTLGDVFEISLFKQLYVFFRETSFVSIFAGIFILLSGISSSFSRSNVKRAIKPLCIAIGISIITAGLMPLMGYGKLGIYFGILHFLGCAMLLAPLLLRLAKKIPAPIGLALSVILFTLTRNIADGYIGLSKSISVALPEFLTATNLLFPFGFVNESYRSADYYSLLPWIFIFNIGIYLGIKIKRDGLPRAFYKPLSRPIEWMGRNSLKIYVLHQPVIFLIGLILEKLFISTNY